MNDGRTGPSWVAVVVLAARALLWTALLPGFFAGYVPWRFFGMDRLRLGLDDPVQIIGLLMMGGGGALLATCIWEFASSGRGTLAPVDPPRRLVIQGVYRYVRNPMYLGVTAIVLGEALLTRSSVLFVYWALWFLGAHLFVVGYEEPSLRRRFGAAYDAYAGSVGRWLPRWRPRPIPPSATPLLRYSAPGRHPIREECSMGSSGTGFTRIQAKNPIVEMDGDEMTRVIWAMVKQQLVEPFVDVTLEPYDLSVENRDRTDDKVTVEAAKAIQRHRVGVKCATITPNQDRVEEYKLKKAWPSPNGTIRAILDGTVFRKPILVKNVPPMVRSWVKPIVIGRHAYGDMYKSAEMRIRQTGKVEIVFTPDDGSEAQRVMIHDFRAPGVVRGVHNLDESIRSFARACIRYAVSEKIELWFSAKDTISKVYHGAFRGIFQQEVDAHRAELDAAGISYSYLLIDDAVARSVRSPGGFLWGCMNYDGDVMSDMVASGFGSLGLMTSVLVSPDGVFEYEAAHGTVTKHYRQHQKGEPTSTNSTATIFAWTGALAKRGELDETPALVRFARQLEQAVIETIESGTMTKDLATIADPRPARHASTSEFIGSIAERLERKLGAQVSTH